LDVREKAFQELRGMGKDAVPELKTALHRIKDSEVRARIERLLEILEPPALEALDQHLVQTKVEVVAIDLWKDPVVERVLPRTLFFQIWKKGQSTVWKVFGFNEEKKALFDASQERSWKDFIRSQDEVDFARVRDLLSAAASSPHASIAAYSGVISTLCLKLDGRAVRVWVKSDGHSVEAFTPDGKSLWKVDAMPVLRGGVGTPVIRVLKCEGNAIDLVLGKHSFARLDPSSGKILSSGSD
jgi:hypothetical protein